MPDWAWLVIIPFFAALVVYGLIRKGKLETKLATELTQRYGAANLLALDPKVQYYGLLSKGAVQPSELGAALAITNDWIHVRTWDYGKLVGFELVLPADQLQRYYQSNTFVSRPGRRISGSGLLVLGYADPTTGAPEELALLLSQDTAVLDALRQATGKPLEER